MTRNQGLSLRLTENEKKLIADVAIANNMTKTDAIIVAMKNYSPENGGAIAQAKEAVLQLREKDAQILKLKEELSYFLRQKRVNAAYEKYKGRTINFQDYKGSKRSVTIDDLKDVYKIILLQNDIK